MKKVLIFTAVFCCIYTFCAETAVNFKHWTIAEISIRKNIAKYVSVKDGVLQLNAPDNAFLYFSTAPYEVKYGNTVRISGKVSGQGTFAVGYNGYADKNYKFSGRDLKSVNFSRAENVQF